MMNKFLVLAGFVVLALSGFVLAQTPQPITVTVGDTIVVAITPPTVDFGNVATGTQNAPAISGDIMFNASGSNVNVSIEVTNVTGFPFTTGLKLDGAAPIGQSWDLLCNLVSNICTYPLQLVTPTLTVPTGTPAGITPGTIVYTIMETP